MCRLRTYIWALALVVVVPDSALALRMNCEQTRPDGSPGGFMVKKLSIGDCYPRRIDGTVAVTIPMSWVGTLRSNVTITRRDGVVERRIENCDRRQKGRVGDGGVYDGGGAGVCLLADDLGRYMWDDGPSVPGLEIQWGTLSEAHKDLFYEPGRYHDACYHHNPATYGYSRHDCDRMFYWDMAGACAYQYLQFDAHAYFACLGAAETYYDAVREFCPLDWVGDCPGQANWRKANVRVNYLQTNPPRYLWGTTTGLRENLPTITSVDDQGSYTLFLLRDSSLAIQASAGRDGTVVPDGWPLITGDPDATILRQAAEESVPIIQDFLTRPGLRSEYKTIVDHHLTELVECGSDPECLLRRRADLYRNLFYAVDLQSGRYSLQQQGSSVSWQYLDADARASQALFDCNPKEKMFLSRQSYDNIASASGPVPLWTAQAVSVLGSFFSGGGSGRLCYKTGTTTRTDCADDDFARAAFNTPLSDVYVAPSACRMSVTVTVPTIQEYDYDDEWFWRTQLDAHLDAAKATYGWPLTTAEISVVTSMGR